MSENALTIRAGPDPHNKQPPNLRHLPLQPEPLASIECLARRVQQLYDLLRPRFSDAATLRAVDVAVDAVLKALEDGSGSSKTPSERAGWLWKVATNAAIRASKKEILCVCLQYDLPDYRHAASEDENDEIAEAIREEVNKLPEKQRLVTELIVFQGLSVRHAACEMGVAPGTITYHYGAALQRLKTTLPPHIIATLHR